MVKRGKEIDKLKTVIELLVNQEKLPIRYCDHALTGNFNYARECHVEPDWLLIYTITDEFVRLERTGTHSDLFK
jgi:mRNA interferase YafQ